MPLAKLLLLHDWWTPKVSKIVGRAGLVGAGYFVIAALSMSLTRFDGALSFIWVANAWLLAVLMYLPTDRWFPTLVAAGLANFAATTWFGLGIAAGPVMAGCALSEAAIGALLLRRAGVSRGGLGTLWSTAVFAVAAGGIAASVTAFPAAATATVLTGGWFWSHWLHWLIGHSLGTITFSPMLLMLFEGRLHRGVKAAGRRGLGGAVLPILLTLGVIIGTFAQSRFPLLFLPMLPLVLMSFRYGQAGAAFTSLMIALIGGGLTIAGFGPVQLIDLHEGHRMQYFQFYLAAAVLTALPVAAELSHRRRLFNDLQKSEARFRILTNRSSDVIMSTDLKGIIDYLSPSITQLADYQPAELLGRRADTFIHPDDRRLVETEHRQALATPDATRTFEYRGLAADGSYRWLESSLRGVVNADGAVTGVISAIRDISRRKIAETELALAAITDPLTGLPNRRAFKEALDDRIADAERGNGEGYCAIVDFDHFKRINDQLGHDAGDRALVAFAEVAEAVLAAGEMAARIGGEEFAILLARPGAAAATEACNALRLAIAALRLQTRLGAPIDVTVSIGLTPIDGHRFASDILAIADTALYRAKSTGRNRVALATNAERHANSPVLALSLAG